MIYELRIYTAVPGKMQAIQDRFAHHTLRLFQKHGINAVGFWTQEVGDNVANTLYYLLGYESLADKEQKWSALQRDPEWIRVRDESEKTGPIIQSVVNRILRPTSFSPMQ